MIARWISIIETYDSELRYRPGRQHLNADALSRRPKRKCLNHLCHDCFPSNKVVRKNDDDEADALYSVKETDLVQVSYRTFLSPGTSSSSAPGQIDEKLVPSNGTGQTQDQDCSFLSLNSPIQESREINGTNDSNWLQIWNTEELQEMQAEDPSVQFILNMKCENDVRPVLPDKVKANQIIKALWHQWNSLEIKSGLLYRRWQDAQGHTVYKLIAPEKIKKTVFENLHLHLTAGHLGRDRTLDSIKRRFYWPGVREDIEGWVKSCDTCAKVKPGPGRGKAALKQFKVNAIMQCVAVDNFGPLPISENGNQYIIVLGEYFSKWVEAWAVPNHTAQTVADKLVVEFFTRYGCPQQIHTGQGREFQSDLFKILCRKFGIRQTRTTPYRPNSDGLVERFNRTLKQMLRAFAAENPHTWDDYLPFVLMAYRATQNKSTSCTPNLVFLQREISCPLDLMVGPPPNTIDEICPIQYIEWVKSAMEITNDFVFRNIGKAAKRQKSGYDRGLKPRQYKKGSWVWRYYPPTANQKINFGWTGPFLVLKCISETNYLIQKGVDKPIIDVHVDDLKPYENEVTPDSWLDEQESQETAEINENSANDETNESFEIDSDHNTSATLPNAESLLDESIIRVPVKEPVKRTQVQVIRTRRERPIKPKKYGPPIDL